MDEKDSNSIIIKNHKQSYYAIHLKFMQVFFIIKFNYNTLKHDKNWNCYAIHHKYECFINLITRHEKRTKGGVIIQFTLNSMWTFIIKFICKPTKQDKNYSYNVIHHKILREPLQVFMLKYIKSKM